MMSRRRMAAVAGIAALIVLAGCVSAIVSGSPTCVVEDKYHTAGYFIYVPMGNGKTTTIIPIWQPPTWTICADVSGEDFSFQVSESEYAEIEIGAEIANPKYDGSGR